MRGTLHAACAFALFIIFFVAVFIFFKAPDLHVSALIGSGLFFVVSLFVLWGDFVQSEKKRPAVPVRRSFKEDGAGARR
jgi:uncharacterized MnhB-related membrane protein